MPRPDVVAEANDVTDDAPTAPTAREMATAAAVSVSFVAVLTLNAAFRGALGAARNDDWAFLRVVFRFAESGEFSLDGWTQMSFVGQAVMAWPIARIFGPNIVAMQLLVVVVAAVGLCCAYALCRSFVSLPVAALATSALAVGPIFGSLAVSFMTDLPSMTAQLATMLVAVHLLRSGWSSAAFVLMCSLGVFAFSIREYGAVVLAVCAVAVVARCRPSGADLKVFAGASAAAFAIMLGLFAWRSGFDSGVSTEFDLTADGARAGLEKASRAVITLSLLVSPVLALLPLGAAGRRLVARPRRAVPVVALVVVVGVLSALDWLSNYIGPSGSYVPLVAGEIPAVLGPEVDRALRVVGFVTFACLAAVAGAYARGPRHALRRPIEQFRQLPVPAASRALVTAVVMTLGGLHLVLLVTTTAPLFDRNLVFFVPLVVAVAASVGSTGRAVARAGVLALFAMYATLGVVFVDAAAIMDGGKWRAAESVAETGVPAANVDGGFEWFNFHQTGPASFEWSPGRPWWTSFYAGVPVCATVVLGLEAESSLVSPVAATSVLGRQYRFGAVAGPESC